MFGSQDLSASATAAKSRKPGQDIGSDFELEECPIPGADEMEYRLDDTGVFQVYENRKGKLRNTPNVSWKQVANG